VAIEEGDIIDQDEITERAGYALWPTPEEQNHW
jgi:hypothetical protein